MYGEYGTQRLDYFSAYLNAVRERPPRPITPPQSTTETRLTPEQVEAAAIGVLAIGNAIKQELGITLSLKDAVHLYVATLHQSPEQAEAAV